MNKKKLIIVIAIFVIGLVSAGFSFVMINKNIQAAKQTKQIVVASRNLNPYETLTSSDLKYVDVPINTDAEKLYTDKSLLVGKVVTSSLTQNDWIVSDYVSEPESIKNLAFLTLKTDYTRTGGAKPGDVVDIYYINSKKENGVEVTIREKVAYDVVVINITDKNGRSIYEQNENVLGSSKAIPIEAVKVAVDTSKVDIDKLVEASVLQNNGYVLVVKK